ncbi:7875_t:CDS:1, partial [Racocetra persica]
NQSENILITNPIVSVRRRKPSGRVKSSIEIQESSTEKYHYLSNTDINIQQPDNRKRYKICSEKNHNRAI